MVRDIAKRPSVLVGRWMTHSRNKRRMKSCYVINFLGSLPKEEVYKDYLNLCEQMDKEPLSKAMLGKIVHQYSYAPFWFAFL